ncbi:hypothetical protein SGLAD_v1c00580 [Spiroplasma gladiatoris]|uniref:Transmembrane protein n=1 Tax=Spiroplasma gladiatoris TaxID=2143 RepID=A0A4V1AQ49_9MOLU|nr:hypothetical protein [Spiroplasma gladiatoris]QBQ07259.1 hypothetical protein SGLAD_v1c00580 [Spiroplasma gladiatoris]
MIVCIFSAIFIGILLNIPVSFETEQGLYDFLNLINCAISIIIMLFAIVYGSIYFKKSKKKFLSTFVNLTWIWAIYGNLVSYLFLQAFSFNYLIMFIILIYVAIIFIITNRVTISTYKKIYHWVIIGLILVGLLTILTSIMKNIGDTSINSFSLIMNLILPIFIGMLIIGFKICYLVKRKDWQLITAWVTALLIATISLITFVMVSLLSFAMIFLIVDISKKIKTTSTVKKSYSLSSLQKDTQNVSN